MVSALPIVSGHPARFNGGEYEGYSAWLNMASTDSHTQHQTTVRWRTLLGSILVLKTHCTQLKKRMPKKKPVVAEKSSADVPAQRDSKSDVESIGQSTNTASEQADAGAPPLVESVEGQSGARIDIEGGADRPEADVERGPV
jgi:hypothetical protein